MKYYLSIATPINNEELYIAEWIEYHLAKGVEHFYIGDTGSADNTKESLKPYMDVITYKEFNLPVPYQLTVMNELLAMCKDETRWIGFVDPDEFVVTDGWIPDTLKDYESFDGIGVNWVIYGSAGHDRRPEGGVLNNYTYRSEYNHPVNLHIKSIANPQSVQEITHPHYFIYKAGCNCVTENKEPINSPFSEYWSGNKIRMNHYFCKSKEDYENKIKRGRCDVVNEQYDLSIFDAHDLNDIYEPLCLD